MVYPTGAKAAAQDGITREIGEPGAGNRHAGFCGGRGHKMAMPVHQGHRLERGGYGDWRYGYGS